MKQFDIIFINPPLSQEERYGIKFKAGGQTPPTGLALLAAICRKKGYKTAIIDAPAVNFSSEDVINDLIKKNPKYVGITAVTISIFNAKDLCLSIKKHLPNIKIILGGPHITAVPDETIKRMGNFFDIAVIGEGDITILELLDALKKNKSLNTVKGIAYPAEDNKKLIFTEPQNILTDLDSLPFPAWDLLPNLSKYYTPPAHTVKKFPAALLVTSRGCPGLCTFCDNQVFGRRFRGYSADYIIKMIKHLKKEYNINEIQFRDDNFLVFKERTKEICEKIIEEKIDIVWSCAGRVDMITPETLVLLKKAGCWQIWYGIESGSNDVLKAIKKNTNVEIITKAITETKKAGISPCGFFIIGMPTETEKDIKKTIDLLLKLPLDEFHISHLVPFPGSEIYYNADKFGKFDNDWKKLSGWLITFIPKKLSEKKLVYYSSYAFRKFYFRPRIIFNYIKKINSFRALKIYFIAFLGLIQMILKKKR